MPVVSTQECRPASFLLALLCSTALAGGLLSLAPARAQAQVVWQGDVDNDFGNGSNWVGDAVPSGATIGIFDGTSASQTPHVSTGVLLGGLEFAAGAPSYNLSVDGGTLGLYTGIVNNSGQVQTVDINSGVMQLGLDATLSQIVINNSGHIQFDGSSDGSGATVVNDGSIALRGTFGAGTVSIGSLSGTGAFRFADIAGQRLELGALGLDDTMSGVIGTFEGVGDGRITKVGTGRLTLSGNNSYSGGTTISAGTIVAASDNALGSGLVTLAGGDLALSGAPTLDNDIDLAAAATIRFDAGADGVLNGDIATQARMLTLNTLGNGTIDGDISGTSSIEKVGLGRLTLSGDSSGFTGNAIVSEGRLDITGQLGSNEGRIEYTGSDPDETATVRVAGADAIWTVALVEVGHNSSGALIIENRGRVSSGLGAVAGNIDGTGSVVVSGSGSSWESSGMISVGHYGNGSLVIEDGGSVASQGQGVIGGATYGTGTAEISGGGSLWTSDTLSIGLQGNGTLTLAEGGTVSLTGATLDLASQAGSFGTLNIGAASGETAREAGTVDAASVTFGPGTGTLVFNHTGNPDGSNLAFDSSLIGQGTILHENGTTSLTGDNSGFTGTTTVSGGTLLVNGTLGSAAAGLVVDAGGTLGGSGTIGGNATVDGTLSAGNSPGTLTVNGNLVLNGGSTSVFELNSPGVVGGTGASGNDLVKVSGDLTLGGTLDVRAAAGGYYRLFDYDGTLSGGFASGTVTGTGGFTPVAPGNPDIRYEVPGQVNLSVLGAGQTMQFWDGGDTTGNGTVDGGAGTWTGFGANWTDSVGGANGGWGGSIGVFAGAAGATVTVEAAQSFDTLQFSTHGYTLTGGTLALTPASGAAGTLNIDNGVSTTIGSIIADGTGNVLKKVGGGILTLTGSNTYTGGTQLFGGVLAVSADANLGAASGGLTFDEGTLQNTAAFASARDITLEAGGGTFRTDANLTLTGMVSGTGALTKDGGGTLTLSGTNTYEGGTTIRYGNVIATSDGALGSGAVVIDGRSGYTRLIFEGASAGNLAMTVKDGLLNFRNGASAGDATIQNDTSYDSVVFADDATAGAATIFNGSGGVGFYGTADAGNATIVNGAQGYTFFTGSSTADHATIVSDAGGWVDISSLAASGVSIGSLSGDGTVSLGAKALTLGSLGKNDTIGGAIEDGGVVGGVGGSIIKTGAGTLTLNGVNTYTGLTRVEGGKLIVGDDRHAEAVLAGAVNVGAGGTLGGIGTVGTTTIASGATIAPGNSIGTLTVDGDITFAAGSTYQAEITPALDGDLIDASGKATINGGTVHAVKAGGVYAPGSRWTIIGADGGVTGTFDDLTQNMPFVDLALAYDANHVYIDAARNAVAFCDVARTANQCSTGNGLESAGQGNPVYDALAALPDEDSARLGLEALSGELHSSARSALIEDSHLVRDAVNDRIRAAFGDATGANMLLLGYGSDDTPPISAESGGTVAWGRAFGSWRSFDGDGNATGMDSSTGGFLTGVDAPLSPAWRLGMVAGYSRSSFEINDRASSGNSDNYHVGLYAGGRWDELKVAGGLAYSWHDIDTSRSVAFPGFADRLTAGYDGGTFQAFGGVGYHLGAGAVSFEPFANLAHVSLHTGGFGERGGAAALAARGERTDVTFATLGIDVSSAFELGGMDATARGTLGWRHAFGDTTPSSTFAFAGGDLFTVAGVPIARDAAVIEGGLDLGLTKATTLGIAYQGQIASDASQHGFNAKFNVRF